MEEGYFVRGLRSRNHPFLLCITITTKDFFLHYKQKLNPFFPLSILLDRDLLVVIVFSKQEIFGRTPHKFW